MPKNKENMDITDVRNGEKLTFKELAEGGDALRAKGSQWKGLSKTQRDQFVNDDGSVNFEALYDYFGVEPGSVAARALSENAIKWSKKSDTLERIKTRSAENALESATAGAPSKEDLNPWAGEDPFDRRFMLPESASASVTSNPEDRARTMSALDALAEVGRTEGMTRADQAAMELAKQNAFNASKSQQNTLQRSLASRGIGGGGLEAALAASAAQSQGANLAQQQLQSQIAARQRALQAMSQMPGEAMRFQQQNLQENQARANALDFFNQQNTAYAQDMRAQRANAAANAAQQKFQNDMQGAGARAGQWNVGADQLNAQQNEAFDRKQKRYANATDFARTGIGAVK